MAAGRSEMSESKVLHPSDEEFIKFITDNIDNEKILLAYLKNLKRSLTAPILTLKIRTKIEGEEYNLLGFSGTKRKKYFKDLVKLATSEAIDAVLSEDPIDDRNVSTLHALLSITKKTPDEIEGILEIIRKASRAVISAILIKQAGGMTPLFLSLSAEKIACELIHKSSAEAVNLAARITYNGGSLLEFIMLKKNTLPMVNIFLEKISIETMDFMMSLPGIGGVSVLLKLLADKKIDAYNESLITAFVKKTSDETLATLAKQKFGRFRGGLLTWLIVKERSQSVVDTLLSRLDKSTLDYLFLNNELLGMSSLLLASDEDGTNMIGLPPSDITVRKETTASYLIKKYISKEALFSLIKQPANIRHGLADLGIAPTGEVLREFKPLELTAQSELLNNLSKNNAPLFNEIVRKILKEGGTLNLSIKALYRLDSHNLSRYLAQHPEISIEELKQTKAFHSLVNWNYRRGFVARLQDGEILLQKELAFSLTAYHYLKDTHLIEPLSLIVVSYIERDPIINDRLDYEMAKEKHPTRINELKNIYPLIKDFFVHDAKLPFKHDEASIILSYLADHTGMADVAREEYKRDKIKSTIPDLQQKSATSTRLKFSIFGKKPNKERKSIILEHNMKLELSKNEIDQFVKNQNSILEEKYKGTSLSGAAPKTLEDLKKYFEEKENRPCLVKIAELESKTNAITNEYLQACLKLIAQEWKSSSPVTKKMSSQAVQLSMEAKSFGYECKDMPKDGNCFFHAIADQLTTQRLTRLGKDHNDMRARAISYVLDHLDEYKNFLDEHDGDINNFIDRNMDIGTWADHLVISALSRSLNVNIVIVRSDGRDPNIFRQRTPIATLYIANEVGHHYQSLIENKEIVRTKLMSLQNYLDRAPIDGAPVPAVTAASASAAAAGPITPTMLSAAALAAGSSGISGSTAAAAAGVTFRL